MVTLNKDNNWRYTWSGLGSSYTWTVVEKENSGYTVQVERDGITFVITNTYVPEEPEPTEPTPTKPTNPTKPNLPQTGALVASAGAVDCWIAVCDFRTNPPQEI